MNEQFKKFLEGTQSFLKKLGNLTILAVCLSGGFAGGFYYNTALNHIKPKGPTTVMLKTTNVAIDQANDLIILDKKSGDYTIYEDSIGEAIFNLYAMRAASSASQINPAK